VIGSECGCPQCAGNVPLTNNTIDQKLSNRSIKRLGDYEGRTTRIPWQCLECDYVWEAMPTHVLGGTGCPRCGGKLPLTNKIVDQRLVGRPIRRIGDYINAQTKIPWACLDCGNIWEASPTNVVNGQRGCPTCQSYGINEQIMHNLFKEAGIAYESQYSLRNIEPSARRLKFDFYFPSLKLAIEYNGKQHYESSGFWGSGDPIAAFADQQERDQSKRKFCALHDIQLLEIDGREYRSRVLEEYVKSVIIPIIIKTAA
jgi:predicted Zn-ribbon and HTH transcriptional regulator